MQTTITYVENSVGGRQIKNMHLNNSCILVLFKCVSSRLIETLTSVSIKKKSFKFARPWISTRICWIMQWSVNYSSLPDRDGCTLKSMQNGATECDAVSTHFTEDCLVLQDKFLFQHWFFFFFLQSLSSNKLLASNQFQFTCLSFYLKFYSIFE